MFDVVRAWVTVVVAGLLIGAIILAWVLLLGPAFNRADNNLYNTSPQHLQAVGQKFADDCVTLAQTTDQSTRMAIEQDIATLAASVDLNQVDMTPGVRACVNSALKDTGN